MNIFNMINRGASHAKILKDRSDQDLANATEATRKEWLNALFINETRSWGSIGIEDRESISSMVTMLTLAGFAHVYDTKSIEGLEIRVIRGAISAAEQCGKVGSVVSLDDARAFSSACDYATDIITKASHAAIRHAAVEMRKTVGL